ncbi:MAG: hypothetical protein ACE5KZ_05140 [Candidatus Scalinduaceae bacterium]
MDRLILKSQKNQAYQHITDSDLEPSMFEWDVIRSGNVGVGVSRLKYIGTHYFFIFDFVRDEHYCTFSPGKTIPIQEVFTGSLESQMNCLRDWLKNLKREIQITDPWDEIDKYLPGGKINLENEKENSPFSYEQVEHITKALYKLKEEIRKTYDLDNNHNQLIQEKLNYLIDRSKRMGRIDWKNIFVATLMGLVVNLALNPEQAKGFWGLVKICFKGILLLGRS